MVEEYFRGLYIVAKLLKTKFQRMLIGIFVKLKITKFLQHCEIS